MKTLMAVTATLMLVASPVLAHDGAPGPDGSLPPSDHPLGDPARSGLRLNQPAVDHAHAGGGYWVAARDSGVFSYGVPYRGNLYDALWRQGTLRWGDDIMHVLNGPIFNIEAYPPDHDRGYWLAAEDGGVFSFGVPFFGSASGQVPRGAKMIRFGAHGDGLGYTLIDDLGNSWSCRGTCSVSNPPLRVPRPTICGMGPGDGMIGWDDVEFINAVIAHVRPEFHCWLVKIVDCESGWNQFAANPRSSARGYVQAMSYWYDQAFPGDWRSPVWQAQLTQFLLDNGGKSHWVCKA